MRRFKRSKLKISSKMINQDEDLNQIPRGFRRIISYERGLKQKRSSDKPATTGPVDNPNGSRSQKFEFLSKRKRRLKLLDQLKKKKIKKRKCTGKDNHGDFQGVDNSRPKVIATTIGIPTFRKKDETGIKFNDPIQRAGASSSRAQKISHTNSWNTQDIPVPLTLKKKVKLKKLSLSERLSITQSRAKAIQAYRRIKQTNINTRLVTKNSAEGC